MAVNVGDVVEGKVVNIMPFGAFVELPDGKNGLVHISEVAVDYVKDINEYLTLNKIVKALVIGIDEKGKISLSIKKVLQQQEKKQGTPSPVRPANINWSQPVDEDLSFEDKLSKFKSDSDERMQSLKKNFTQNRRNSGGYRRSGGSY